MENKKQKTARTPPSSRRTRKAALPQDSSVCGPEPDSDFKTPGSTPGDIIKSLEADRIDEEDVCWDIKTRKGPLIGFIGAGRVANALAAALNWHGYQVSGAASRTFASAQALAARVPGCVAYPAGQDMVDECDLVFITTPDDAIQTVVADIIWHPGQTVVHCSGADSSEVLVAPRVQGASVGVCHPLQTFAGGEPDPGAFEGITFSLEAEEPFLTRLKIMTEDLGGRWIVLSPEDRVLYHAAAVIACNYMVTLVKLATDLWAGFGVDKERAVPALLPLMKGTLANIEKVGLPDCLTGPIARGDVGTVRKHRKAIRRRAPAALAAYDALGLETLPLALAKGKIDKAAAGDISKELSNREGANL